MRAQLDLMVDGLVLCCVLACFFAVLAACWIRIARTQARAGHASGWSLVLVLLSVARFSLSPARALFPSPLLLLGPIVRARSYGPVWGFDGWMQWSSYSQAEIHHVRVRDDMKESRQ
ncbi:hypothetical protein B0T19DRAFT_142961 [Cercophora scortea]|uniref:Uncharacterized protein n=1 Tax=Cercophora scortea TaxID=314031 RepID=A0AAE0MJ10_9PEZI|nr:hypothetical protein B0T19DRAFT_142961 [Cercophora scortea]